MIIKRQKKFSSQKGKKKDDLNNENIGRNAALAGLGISLAGSGYNTAKMEEVINNSKERMKKPDKSLNDLFKVSGREKDTLAIILKDKDMERFLGTKHNAGAVNDEGIKQLKNYEKLTGKKLPKNSLEGILLENHNKGKKSIILSETSRKDLGAIGHELGHTHYFYDKDADALGKLSHKLYNIKRANNLSIAAGLINGYSAGKKRKEGEEESLAHRLSADAVAGTSQLPMLISEAKANAKSNEYLRKLGSKQRISNANLKAYGGVAAMALGVSELGRAAGIKIHDVLNDD